jgi:hypothetical protein
MSLRESYGLLLQISGDLQWIGCGTAQLMSAYTSTSDEATTAALPFVSANKYNTAVGKRKENLHVVRRANLCL